ncbi:MAG: glycosyltransferase family 2 protein [Thermosynechococcaceae cyanobacterium]
MTKLDVIIPVKDRSTVSRCISVLLEQAELASEIHLNRIILCDGGSREAECQRQLRWVEQFSAVEVLNCPHPGFNKGWLLNQGLEAATAPWVLISDIDILWTATTLNALCSATKSNPNQLCCIQSVQESQPTNIAPQRPRYTYRLEKTAQDIQVKVFSDSSCSPLRPGYGLVWGARSLFQRIGGYRHCFDGWGWEDQDLLIRTQLLGYEVTEVGSVIHLSHSDARRNAFSEQQRPQESRDRNLLICLAKLAAGNLGGDWSAIASIGLDLACSRSPGSISISVPSQLLYAAHPDYPLPKSAQSSI